MHKSNKNCNCSFINEYDSFARVRELHVPIEYIKVNYPVKKIHDTREDKLNKLLLL